MSRNFLSRGVQCGIFVFVLFVIAVKLMKNSNISKETPSMDLSTVMNRNKEIIHNDTETKVENNKPKSSDKEAIVSLAKQISSYNKTVLVSLVNDAYLQFAYSWLCNTKHMGVHKSILIITTDIESKRSLTRDWSDINVVHITLDIGKGDQYYSHVGYVKIMIRRTEILLSLLMADIEIFLLEFDSMWFSNPVPTLQRARGADILVNPATDSGSVFSGGFIYFFPTERTKALWSKVTDMMQQLEQKIKDKNNKKHVYEGENDQVFFSKLIRENYSDIRTKLLPLDTYADGRWYRLTSDQRAKTHPVVVNNNWVLGNRKKMERAKKFGHWFIKEDKTCDMEAVDKVVTKTT